MKMTYLYTSMYWTTFTVFTLLLAAGTVHSDDAATLDNDRRPVYEVTLLESLGGTNSRGNAISERGWVSGYSNLPGNQERHAVLWRDESIIDLGTLGGPGSNSNSNVPLDGLNNRGRIVGISETGEPDPLGEDWSCEIFFPTSTGQTCVGFVWESGEMRELPTLGGNNAFATDVNNRGQMVGWAENDVRDPTCTGRNQVLQFRAVLWEIDNDGEITATELPPFPGDTSGTANAINERGQATGISGICDQAVGRFSARNVVLWDKDEVINLGNLGGKAWHTSWDINERADVVGFSNLPVEPPGEPGDFNAHAFLWTRHDGMQDLGTLPGDVFSQGHGINNRRQVVGISFGGSAGARAFLWQDGEMMNLDDLAPDFNGTLTDARDINEQGHITGSAIDETGATVAFIAKPRRSR